MLRSEIPLKYFRLIFFPIHFLIEISLIILFLVGRYYNPITLETSIGITSMWGWFLVIPSLFISACIVILFISGLKLKKPSRFLTNDFSLITITYILSYLSLARIALIPLSLLYVIPFGPSKTIANLIIITLSLIPPFPMYFLANFTNSPQKTYALTKDAPISIKISMIWILFLTGVMQIFSTNLTILLVSLTFLLVSYFFFNLNLLSVSLTPILMIIHSAFSIFFSITIFTHLQDQEILLDYTQPEVIVITTFFFVVPAVISLILAITFFQKKILAWVKGIQPQEDLSLYYEVEEDEEEEIDDDIIDINYKNES